MATINSHTIRYLQIIPNFLRSQSLSVGGDSLIYLHYFLCSLWADDDEIHLTLWLRRPQKSTTDVVWQTT